MKITSPAFKANAPIPKEYTCEGEDESPPLNISGVPSQAKTLALIMEDPDAPQRTFTHWVLFNLPPSKTHLEPNLLRAENLAEGARQGVNDFQSIGYGGPCPPSGRHRYFFKLFALDRALDLPSPVNKEKLLEEIQGHVLDQAELIGTYQKAAAKTKKNERGPSVDEASEESFPASDAPAWG